MRQIAATALTGLPVYANQASLGTVTKVVFDLATGGVLGLIVARDQAPAILYKENIVELTAEQVTVGHQTAIEDIPSDSLADQANQQVKHLLGLRALTASGTDFGIVTDALLSSPSLILTHLIVTEDSGERMIPKDQIKEITDTAVIFFDIVVKGHLNWHTKMETNSLPA